MVHSTIYGLLICTVIVSIACAASSKNDHNLRIRSKDTSNNHVLRKDALLEEVNEKLKDYDSSKIPVSKRVLTVYHLGVPSLDYSVDVVVNNIKVFTAAVHSHVDSTHVEGLYLFNLLSGEANPYFKYIPCELNNVLCVHLDHESTELEQIVDMETHKDITDVLGRSIISQFKGVFFLNHEARGPFSKARNGEWLSSFAQLIDLPNSLPSATQRRSSSTSTSSDGSSFLDAHKGHAIMMVGRQHNYRDSGTKPIGAVSVAITCEPVPRLLTHAFMLSASLVSRVFSTVAIHSVEETQTHNRTDQLAAVLTTQMLRSGVSIASILQQNMLASEHSSTEKAAGTSSTSGGSSSSAGRYRDKDKDKESHYDHQHEQEHEDRTEVKRDHNMIDQSSHGDTLEGAILGHNMEQEGRHLSSKSSKPKSLSALQVNKAIFDNRCFISHSNEKNSSNPMKWCDLQPSDIVFARFGGTMLKTPGVMCEDAIKSISAATAAIAAAEPTLKLHMPESVYGGPYRELYRQYSVQQWRWQQPSPNMHFLDTAPTKAAKHSYFGMSSKQHSDKSLTAAAAVPLVCFLVRSASVHSLKSDASQPASNLVKMDISLLINSKC